MYRPPDAELLLLQQINEYVSHTCRSHTRLILLGDFNLPNIDWSSLSCYGSHVAHGEELLNIAYANNLSSRL